MIAQPDQYKIESEMNELVCMVNMKRFRLHHRNVHDDKQTAPKPYPNPQATKINPPLSGVIGHALAAVFVVLGEWETAIFLWFEEVREGMIVDGLSPSSADLPNISSVNRI